MFEYAGRLGWYICGGLTGPPAWLVLWIVFDLDTPISLLLVLCLLVLLFAVSVVGCLLGYSSCLVVWIPLFLDPSAGAFGRFDLAALCGCRTLNFFCLSAHAFCNTVQSGSRHCKGRRQLKGFSISFPLFIPCTKVEDCRSIYDSWRWCGLVHASR